MRQPIITRDIERKAIYTDIVYDPEWLYISIDVRRGSSDKGGSFGINRKDTRGDYVIDWGDGSIEKNIPNHYYAKGGIYTVRIKGYINYVGDPSYMHQLFEPEECVQEAIQYGYGFNTNLPMFLGCEKLQRIDPNFFQYHTELKSLSGFFKLCRELPEIPQGLLDPLVNLEDVTEMFSQVGYDLENGNTVVPNGLFVKCTNLVTARGLFGYSNIGEIPNDLFKGLTHLTDVHEAFTNTQISSIPPDLFKDTPLLSDISDCFFGCKKLTSIPRELFSAPNSIENAQAVFHGTNIASIPSGLFDNCSSLKDLGSAFSGCKELSEVPVDLLSKCRDVSVSGMFVGCDELSTDTKEQVINNIGSYYKNK